MTTTISFFPSTNYVSNRNAAVGAILSGYPLQLSEVLQKGLVHQNNSVSVKFQQESVRVLTKLGITGTYYEVTHKIYPLLFYIHSSLQKSLEHLYLSTITFDRFELLFHACNFPGSNLETKT